MPFSVERLESTDLFTGSEDDPRQVLRVHLGGGGTPAGVRVEVDGEATGSAAVDPGSAAVEVGLQVPAGTPTGAVLAVRARVLDPAGTVLAQGTGELTVQAPGWTMWMVSHFHYDPVWWNTQAAYTSEWDLLPDAQAHRSHDQMTGFALVDAHIDLALAEPEYRFVLAELDYLKPYWDSRPHRRAALRQLLAEGRLELVGGTYNEPNTNLTGPETAIRTLVYGVGWQRDVMALAGPGSPASAWQLDVFGHDPQFPSMVADAGLTSSSWARGPYHQWGPVIAPERGGSGTARVMQFASEFEWLGPDGRGILTSYMPAHYSAGWDLDSAASLAQAEERAYGHFADLKPVALTRNVLLPVGTDYTPPAAWIVALHRDWNARYVWPRFVCGLPRDFFAAVRAELSGRGLQASPQTRDMNPVYTGKDVSYIDTKQAQRATENAVGDAEKLATLATLAGGARYPTAALDKAWRQLAFGAHHDAITGSESDEVYLDLLTGWRNAHDLGVEVRDRAAAHLIARIDTAGAEVGGTAEVGGVGGVRGIGTAGRRVVVLNTSSWTRTELVEVDVDDEQVAVVDDAGSTVPAVAARLHPAGTPGGVRLTFLARGVPQLGWRTFALVPAEPAQGWTDVPVGAGQPVTIANEHYRLTVDPARGGVVSGLVEAATGRELIRAGGAGNELVVYDEYPDHPVFGEGPWHLLPAGTSVGSAAAPALSVSVASSALGHRVTSTGTVGGLAYTQELTLLEGVDRVQARTWVDSYAGIDKLLRVRFTLDVPGTRPVSETGAAVIGRGFGFPDVDAAVNPWTLDNPAHRWFGASVTARVAFGGTDIGGTARSGYAPFGVAEVVVPGGDPQTHGPALGGQLAQTVRDLVVALVRAGVTATTGAADGPRYGWLTVDSNLPDVRIAVGGPADNPFVAELAASVPGLDAVLRDALDATGTARIWVPASRPLAEVWVPGADLRGARDLPVLVVAGADAAATAAAVAALVADLADAVVEVDDVVGTVEAGPPAPHSVALLNRGMPGFNVTVDGSLHLSLMRSCSGWPSGTWINPPRQVLPDGSNFQFQHWTHAFEYALVSGPGDWRDADLVRRAASYDGGLLAYAVPAHPGVLPGAHSLLQVLPEGVAELGALKPAGNPLAGGGGPDADPRADGVAIRLYEPAGRGGHAGVTGPEPFSTATRADVLETPREEAKVIDGSISLDLAAFEITTLTAQFADQTGPDSGDPVSLGPAAEPVQPVPARYWLNDSGPAPLGYQQLSLHLDPPATLLTPSPGESLTATLTAVVSSDRLDAPTPVTVRVVAPEGFAADPAERVLELGPDGWTTFEVLLTAGGAPLPGPYVVEITAVLPDGQTGLDTAIVWVGEPGTEPLLGTGAAAEALSVPAGSRCSVDVEVTNRCRSAVTGQLAVIGPWGTWDFVDAPALGFTLPPGSPDAPSRTPVRIEVAVPAGTRPGSWWLSPKVMALGRVLFAPTIGLQVVAAST